MNKRHFPCSKTAPVTGRGSISLLLDPAPVFSCNLMWWVSGQSTGCPSPPGGRYREAHH